MFTAGSNGAVVGTTNQTVNYGDNCSTVLASAQTGYHFTSWSGDYTGTDNPLTLTNVTSDKNIIANFSIDDFTVTFTAGANGTIAGSTTQKVTNGGNCAQVTAVPATGYHFTGWSGDYTGTTNPLTITNVTANMNITANFSNTLPVIDTFSVDKVSGVAPLTVNFTCTAHDPNGTIVEYDLKPGEGSIKTNTTGIFSFIYPSPGTYQATMTVKDNAGATVTSSALTIVVGSPGRKAIILVGGPQNDSLRPIFEQCAVLAYSVIKYQGFGDENIYYLITGPDSTKDAYASKVRGPATKSYLQTASRNWAADAQELVIYLVDHGDNGVFRMSSTETLTSTQLGAWLDQLQNSVNVKLRVIYEACKSGSFVHDLSASVGKERILIFSAGENQLATLLESSHISFSYFFWVRLFQGGSFWDAFLDGKRAISAYQTSGIDDNGNGVLNEKSDGQLAATLRLG
ncbi:MAG: InlB B-repeat-containing protein, partial [Deltaproteobacteria bacterium]|nr:InlB B-repeat-containing protein [Deltaproteobacteria bacterium]